MNITIISCGIAILAYNWLLLRLPADIYSGLVSSLWFWALQLMRGSVPMQEAPDVSHAYILNSMTIGHICAYPTSLGSAVGLDIAWLLIHSFIASYVLFIDKQYRRTINKWGTPWNKATTRTLLDVFMQIMGPSHWQLSEGCSSVWRTRSGLSTLNVLLLSHHWLAGGRDVWWDIAFSRRAWTLCNVVQIVSDMQS